MNIYFAISAKYTGPLLHESGEPNYIDDNVVSTNSLLKLAIDLSWQLL